MKKQNVAVVGVGAVGIEMLRCLKQRDFPIESLRVFARSARDIKVDEDTYSVEATSPDAFSGIDIALFAGTEGEKGAAVTYSGDAIKRGAVVIDNGADFRLEPNVPLVVPEVNPEDAKGHKGLIANPNCATIQMVVALAPIHKKVGLERIIVSSYQAASGAGRAAAEELISQTKEVLSGKEVKLQALPRRLAFNVFPHIGGFGDLGYTSEEWKTVKETHKILHDNSIKISATTVRVPVITGHSEAIYIRCRESIQPDKVRKLLEKSPGIKVIDDPSKQSYPTAIDGAGIDDVLVGRIRQDPSNNRALWLWVVADNLRKGAALNAVQIAELVAK